MVDSYSYPVMSCCFLAWSCELFSDLAIFLNPLSNFARTACGILTPFARVAGLMMIYFETKTHRFYFKTMGKRAQLADSRMLDQIQAPRRPLDVSMLGLVSVVGSSSVSHQVAALSVVTPPDWNGQRSAPSNRELAFWRSSPRRRRAIPLPIPSAENARD